MAFKQFDQYIEEKNGDFFTLRNDGDSADVIILYQSAKDVLVADCHYISSKGYSGYAHCLGDNCPACNYPTKSGRGIRKDVAVFIPVFNISKNKIEYWQRSYKFVDQVLTNSVFKNFPNPSEFVFHIVRHGAAGDQNTRYEIRAAARNNDYPYEKILSDFNISFPASYSTVCKELTYDEMDGYLNSDVPSDLPNYGYTPVPRGSASSAESSDSVPEPAYTEVPTVVYSESDENPPFEPTSDSIDTPTDAELDNVQF